MERRMGLGVQRAFNPMHKHKPVLSVGSHHSLIYSTVGEEILHSKLYGKSLFCITFHLQRHQYPCMSQTTLSEVSKVRASLSKRKDKPKAYQWWEVSCAWKLWWCLLHGSCPCASSTWPHKTTARSCSLAEHGLWLFLVNAWGREKRINEMQTCFTYLPIWTEKGGRFFCLLVFCFGEQGCVLFVDFF